MTTIAILDYGSGNLHSVARALQRVGGDPVVSGKADEAEGADALVIPGVGRFGQCVQSIIDRGLDSVIRAYMVSPRPIFGVCVGMQVMMDGSEEDPQAGLGILPGTCRRLPETVKVPHMGWNEVSWSARHPYVTDFPQGTRFYFVHSFAADLDEGTTVGTTEHGREFAAVAATGNVFATQFHPEKSGDAGLALYEQFVKDGSSA
jgi:glutamine amidotransferase